MLFCADIEEAISGAHIIQFADDVNLVTADRDPERAVVEMNETLEAFSNYAGVNWLAVEPTKSQVLICTGKDREHIGVKCRIGGQDLEVAETLKIVGFHLDEDLLGRNIPSERQGRRTQQQAGFGGPRVT